MSETEPYSAQPPEPPDPPAAPVRQKVRLRDQLFGIWSLVVVALAGVIIGGLAGYGIHAATDDHGGDPMVRFGPRGGGPGGPFPGGGGPWQGPGQDGGPGMQQQPPAQPTPTPSQQP